MTTEEKNNEHICPVCKQTTFYGEDEHDLCPLCESDELSQCCIERDAEN